VRRAFVLFVSTLGVLAFAAAASAGDIVGLDADATGSVLPAAQVTARNLATGEEQFAQADLEGKFRFSGVGAGTYLVTVESPGFSRDSRTVEVGDEGKPVDVKFTLVPGRIEMGVTVTAARSERDTAAVPLRTDTFGRDALASKSPLSVGDALLQAPGITPVGSGPMQVRPRLRGLDSTRVLVLVDGERLNNARTATDMFTTALVQSGQFRVVERNRMNEGVVREKQLQQAGWASGNAAQQQLRGAQYIFEGTVSEANVAESQGSGGINVAGLQIGGGRNQDSIAVDVRVVDAGNGDVLDAVTVRKPIATKEAAVSGVGNLIGTVMAQRGRSSPYVPDAQAQGRSSEGLDSAVRAAIDEAVLQLARRFGT
jgi:curli biogenesis system outer membrane secretion channel CsgG